ncbi:glutathione S-transferase [Tropicimonas sp. IMCC6043]|uniref:glutathione S-transferase n=1 Tax=Tropicimonas sp. IMCC6043 TaxID=2510645 RepID=UPI00101D7E35|nr:glutathione S-transferase [Tropicimonas sp. IMCC6043]RYH08317.1 glutathione S-transferase [Tropicimonas sp. IMCC6043]
MTYHLYLGDPGYSSWSLRGWLLFERFGLTADLHWVDFLSDSVAAQLAPLAPARTVPTLRLPDGAIVSESLAIAEELATRNPGAGHWPADPAARATARNLAAEMHAGFTTLRSDCPMNLRTAYRDVPLSADLEADLRRLEQIWAHARATTGSDTPWLCGAYSAADAFFAPVAARVAGYGLDIFPEARAYVAAHLADPAFRRWRALAMARGNRLPWYDRDYPQTDWPGPTPLPARALQDGTAENDVCPFSGKPVSDLAEIDGHCIGFCNPICRDKAVADAAAWPQVMALLGS